MRMVRNGVTVDFTYINGIPATISFNGMTFYYVVNGQGDVTGITDSQGNLQLSYYYDAWDTPYYIYATGNTYGSTLLTINPIMYRGYVFDRELGMYYLQSRYYIPQIARFLNADGLVSTGQGILGNNMFAYCGNNPVCRSDPSGYFFIRAIKSLINKVKSYASEERNHVTDNQPTGYISDQSAQGIGERRLGFSTVSHGGCGVIATYNALVTLGDSPDFESVLSYYNKWNRTFLKGFAGIVPETVASYFRGRGYRVLMTDNPDEIDLLSRTADASIMWYMFPMTIAGVDAFGAHYVEYHREGSGYTGYNTSENGGIYSFRWASDYGYAGERYYAMGIFIYKQ